MWALHGFALWVLLWLKRFTERDKWRLGRRIDMIRAVGLIRGLDKIEMNRIEKIQQIRWEIYRG